MFCQQLIVLGLLCVAVAQFPVFEVNATAGRDFGAQIGSRFKTEILAHLSEYPKFSDVILPFYGTEEGKRVYSAFLSSHRRKFPSYVEELEGLSEAIGVPFAHIFLLNLRQEFSHFAEKALRPDIDHCSDYLVKNEQTAAICHNEDENVSFKNKSYILAANVEEADGSVSTFTSFVYPGELPSGAFAFNAHGVAFSMNFVGPNAVVLGGIGRNFVARDLLRSTDMADAIARATIPQAFGRNFNLMHHPTRDVVNVEVAPNRHAITPIDGAFFHANQYQKIENIDQYKSASSQHRLARSLVLPVPTDIQGALSVLADTGDSEYPIYRNGEKPDTSVTLCTAVFDADSKTMRVYLENPLVDDYMLFDFY